MDYAAARAVLHRLSRFEVKPGLERISHLLEGLGHPERAYPAIHVAGTNGKGSVVAMLDAVLRAAGYRVGRVTSPELLDFRDRVAIDGAWLPEEDWAAGVERMGSMIDEMSDQPAQFEAITAFALDAFAQAMIDVAVVEVGLGGRFDATNVTSSILSILTNVSLDHTAILGDSIEKIAWEKAGIAKKDVPLLVGPLEREALSIVENECGEVGAKLVRAADLGIDLEPDSAEAGSYRIAGPDLPERVTLSLLGGYQRENLELALAAIELLRAQGFDLPSDAVREGLESVTWPGRFEVVRQAPTVILEGAHNLAGAQALAADVERFAPDRAHRSLLFGVLGDKDAAGMLDALGPRFERVALTASSSPRALAVSDLGKLADELCVPHACYDSVASALDAELAASAPEDVWFVAGSLTVVAEARRYLEGGG